MECFRLLFDHLAWIEHQFLSGCGKSREVRTLELIGQIKNFMDKDCRVSIETISQQLDVSMGTVHIIIREELKMRKNCAKFVPRVLREDQKERRCHDSREMVELINSDPTVLDALVTCDESWIYCYDPETKRQKMLQKRMECFRLLLEHLAWIEHQFLSSIRDSRKPGSLWGMMRGVGGVRRSIHQSWLAKGLGLGLLCWGFKGVQEEIPREEASTPQIVSVAFPPGQCTCLQLHPCHRLFDQDGHQDSSSVSL